MISRLILLLLVLSALAGCKTTSVSTTQAVRLGDEMNNQNNYPEAIRYYEQYLSQAPSLGLYRNKVLEGEVCRKLAHAYSTQGKYDEALRSINKALGLDSTEANNQLNVIEDYRQLGITHSYLGNYQTALKFLTRTMELNEGMDRSLKDVKRLSIADTYMSLAQVQLALGNYSRGSERVENAMNLYNRIPGELTGRIEGHLLQGIIHINRNEIEDGIGQINQSIDLSKEAGINTARQQQALGDAAEAIGELEEALKFKLLALDEAEGSSIIPQIIWSNLRVGDVYQKIGDIPRATEYYQRALDLQFEGSSSLTPSIQLRLGDVQQAQSLFLRSGSKIGAAIAGLKLGEQYLSEGQTDSASKYFNNARELFMSAESDEGVARANLNLSKSLLAAGNPSEAQQMIDEAFTKSTQPETLWQLHFNRGIIQESTEEFDNARESYVKAIDMIEEQRGKLSIEEFRSAYFDDKTDVYDRLLLLTLQHGETLGLNRVQSSREAFAINERARSRSFLDLLGNHRIEAKDIGDSELLNQEHELRLKVQQIGKQIQTGDLKGHSLSELEHELRTAQEEYLEIIHQIKLRNPAYSGLVSVDPVDITEVQKTLDNKTAIVQYWVSENNLITWIITNSSIQHKVSDIGSRAIERQIAVVRNSIRFRLESDMNKALRSLYEMLILEIEPWLSQYENIGFVPHRSLHFLPFQALIDGKGNYLISEKNLFFAPSASVYHYCVDRETPDNPGLLGMALGDHKIGEFAPLPGTEMELQQIGQFYGQPTATYEDETSESYLKENGHGYGMIHMATHGVLNANQPMYSYLLMNPSEEEDGKLTVNEIFDLDLNSRLVTLSACETGLGKINKGDEMIGLSRAFIYAGSPAVIVSLWTVDDITTAMLMTRFYQYLNSGFKMHESLSMAQRDLLDQDFSGAGSRSLRSVQWDNRIQSVISEKPEKNKNPYFWAPFILIGNGFQ